MNQKKYFNIIILSICILLSSYIMHAQVWTNDHSVAMRTDLLINNQGQKIKPYIDKNGREYLIEISKSPGMDTCYFTLWNDNSNIVYESFLNTPNLNILDFTILGEYIYFCGQRVFSSNTIFGIIGRFNIHDFLDDGNFNYDLANIGDSEILTKLVASYQDSDTTSIVAIGYDSINTNFQNKLVHLKVTNSNTQPVLYNGDFTNAQGNQKEVFWDIEFDGNKVITLSHIHPTDQYVVRYHNPINPYANIGEFTFSDPNIFFIYSSNHLFDYSFHLADISEFKIAVAVFAMSNQNRPFTMVNFLKKASHYVFSSQLFYHSTKSYNILEMEYSQETNKLLILGDEQVTGTKQIQSMYILNPDITTAYIGEQNYFANSPWNNHFSVIPQKRYAVAGARPFSQTSFSQIVTTKFIPATTSSCVIPQNLNVQPLNFQNGVPSIETIYSVSIGCGWNSFNAYNSNEGVIIECNE